MDQNVFLGGFIFHGDYYEPTDVKDDAIRFMKIGKIPLYESVGFNTVISAQPAVYWRQRWCARLAKMKYLTVNIFVEKGQEALAGKNIEEAFAAVNFLTWLLTLTRTCNEPNMG